MLLTEQQIITFAEIATSNSHYAITRYNGMYRCRSRDLGIVEQSDKPQEALSRCMDKVKDWWLNNLQEEFDVMGVKGMIEANHRG